MTGLYLTGIELSEFRSFARLDFELAPQPGVLIVHGSNGLGKSSLFDAMEWTLTGEIDHFRDADGYRKYGNYLCRWGKGVDPTSSALVFSDGNRIERQLASDTAVESTLKGDVEDIADFLRVPEWRQPISALNRYLLLTHFLGQSTLSRLTHREPGERFAILKEASQSAELERFGLSLHGPGNTQPARAFTKRAAELERDVAELRMLLDQEEEAWGSAQAAGALTDGEAYELSESIISMLRETWRHIAIQGVPPAPADRLDAGGLQSLIDDTAERLRGREFDIAEARRMIALRQRHEAAMAAAAGSTDEAERELAVAVLNAENARQTAAAGRSGLQAAQTNLAVAKNMHAQLVELIVARQSLDAARLEREMAVASLANARSAVTQAETDVQRSERQADIVARLRREMEDLAHNLQSGRASIEEGRLWLSRSGAIESRRAELQTLEEANPQIEVLLSTTRGTFEAASTAVEQHRQALKVMQNSVGELSAAVTTIAAHLPADAHECPACASRYASPAELKARIDAAAQRLAPMVAGQQDALRAAEVRLTATAATLAAQEDVLRRIELLKAEIRDASEANHVLLTRLGWSLDSGPREVQNRLAAIEGTVEGLEASVARRARWIDRLSLERGAGSTQAAAIRRRDAARRAEDAAARRLADAITAERLADEAASTSAERLYPGQSLPTREEIQDAAKRAAATLEQAQQAYNAASKVLSEQELRLGALQQAEAGLSARIAQVSEERNRLRDALAELAGTWQAAGWSDADFTEDGVEAAATELARGRERLAKAEATLRRFREGRDAWSRQQAHRTALDRLTSIADVAPNSTRDQVRAAVEQRRLEAERRAHQTARAREIAASASAAIATAVSDFNAEYIEPLDRLTKRINQAILCDPRIGIDLHVNKRTVKQTAKRDGELPEKRKIDPKLVHSEGQMAALSVSMLCAASLTYPWSRWRALILDDPLQHNDSIHAAAFADLVGNLVQVKDYQVLLSTHDLGQADFLRRKFHARGIPCAVLNLLGRGKTGVETEFLPSGSRSASVSVSA